MEKLYFLDKEYIRRVATFTKLRNDHIEAIEQSLNAVVADEMLIELALKWQEEIFSQTNTLEEVRLNDWSIPDYSPLLPVIVLFSGFEKLRNYYVENGIDETELQDLLFDVGRNLDECKARKGSYKSESFVFKWLTRHFTARLFQLGRLQYEVIRFDRDNELIKKGDFIINVHIPSGGRMPYDDVRESYKRAVNRFRMLHPELSLKGFVCKTWMLSPQLKDILDSSSNIVRFLNDYRIFDTNDDEGFYGYVFVKKPDDLNSLSEETSLQRAIKKHLLAGGEILSGSGFIPMEDIT